MKVELVTFSQSNAKNLGLDDDVAGFLSDHGVPRRIFDLRASTSLEKVGAPGAEVICFASSTGGAKIGIDPRTREVIRLDASAPQGRKFVNTSATLFADTARAVAGQVPFHSPEATADEVRLDAERVAAMIRAIDPGAMEPDRYWSSMVDDIKTRKFDPPPEPDEHV